MSMTKRFARDAYTKGHEHPGQRELKKYHAHAVPKLGEHIDSLFPLPQSNRYIETLSDAA